MKRCRVCDEKKAVNKSNVCLGCVNTKHFKCFCCDKKFSYVELTVRNLNIGSQYKCMKPRMLQNKCEGCEKFRRLLTNYNRRCLRCLNKDNANVKLEMAEKHLLEEYEKHNQIVKQYEIARMDIKKLFTDLQRIKDPIAERIKIEGRNGLLCVIGGAYASLSLVEGQSVECATTIKRIKLHIIRLQSEINKINIVRTCYEAAKTFLLCGLRPEIAHYIPKQIQKWIAKLILQDLFIMGV